MANIYCGNNAQNPDLLSGALTLGTRSRCLRKGIGVGRNLPLDPSYAGPYAPIDARREYCGDASEMPDGYDIVGNLPRCLQRGVGIGKAQRAAAGFSPKNYGLAGEPDSSRGGLYLVVFAVGAAVLFLFLYLVKPGMRQKKNRKQIVWKKFALVYSLTMICFGVLLFATYAVAGKRLHNA